MGNGSLEISVWGDEFLCLTIARAKVSASEISENEGRALSKAGDVAGLRERLANSFYSHAADCAHLELQFAGAVRPIAATLGADGILRIALDNERVVTLECAMDEEVAWLESVDDAQWQLRPACEANCEVSAPLEVQIADGERLYLGNARRR